MKQIWHLLILGSIAFGVPSTVTAQSLGINFRDTVDVDPSTLAPTDMAGAVPQANWNNMAAAATGTNVGGLLRADGTASSVTVTWNSPNTWSSVRNGNAAANLFPAGGDRNLMSGYIDTLNTSPAGTVTVTVNNIDAALRTPAYDVLVYFLGDSTDNRGGGYTINDGTSPITRYGSIVAGASAHVEDPGTDIDNSMDGTYVRFRELTGSSFTLVGDATLVTPNPAVPGQTNGFRAPINAIQIVRSNIIPGDVNGDGSVNIADFHILRSNLFRSQVGLAKNQGDLIDNDIVDFADYRLWKQNAPPGLAASISLVPEPGALLMLALGGALVPLITRRRQREARQSSL